MPSTNTLRWSPRFEAAAYRVYRSIFPIDTGSLPEPIATLGPQAISYVDIGPLADGTTYYYAIAADNNESPSATVYSFAQITTGGDVVEPTGSTFWRLVIEESNGSSGSAANISRLQFYDASGAEIPTIGGSATASAGSGPGNAFDGDNATYFSVGTLPASITYEFADAKEIAHVAIRGRSTTDFALTPTRAKLQHSDDGINFTDVFTFDTSSTWQNGQTRDFPPLPKTNLLTTDTENASGASWTKAGLSASGDLLTADGTNGVHRAIKAITTTANTRYRFSCETENVDAVGIVLSLTASADIRNFGTIVVDPTIGEVSQAAAGTNASVPERSVTTIAATGIQIPSITVEAGVAFNFATAQLAPATTGNTLSPNSTGFIVATVTGSANFRNFLLTQ